jgi:murein DD-endopeptidase MepM/ murein hydrolase activator NlpD
MLKKKKLASERFFSLIFVPDQEKDPRSFSMSYARGFLVLGGAALLCLLLIWGLFAFFWVGHLDHQKRKLISENEELLTKNKQIEPLIKEFQEIRTIVDKIKKGFGSTLGLEQEARQALSRLPLSNLPAEATNSAQTEQAVPETQRTHIPLTHYFLYMQEKSIYNPESMPTLLPIEGYLTTHFQKRSWYYSRGHQGIDIAAEKGSVIRAAGSGIVVMANWTPDLGHVVIIDHGHGFYSYYGHAQRLLVFQGNQVKKGQPVALLGSSGISSAPHLHFEIWKNGEPLDPETFLFVLRERNKNTR